MIKAIVRWVVLGPCFLAFFVALVLGSPLIMLFAWLDGANPVQEVKEHLHSFLREGLLSLQGKDS